MMSINSHIIIIKWTKKRNFLIVMPTKLSKLWVEVLMERKILDLSKSVKLAELDGEFFALKLLTLSTKQLESI